MTGHLNDCTHSEAYERNRRKCVYVGRARVLRKRTPGLCCPAVAEGRALAPPAEVPGGPQHQFRKHMYISYMCMYVYTCACMYTCIYKYMHTYMYLRVYAYEDV